MNKSKLQLHKLYYRNSYRYNFIYYFLEKDNSICYIQGRFDSTGYVDNIFLEDRRSFDFDGLYVLKDQDIIKNFNLRCKQKFVFNVIKSIKEKYFDVYLQANAKAINKYPGLKYVLIIGIFNENI